MKLTKKRIAELYSYPYATGVAAVSRDEMQALVDGYKANLKAGGAIRSAAMLLKNFKVVGGFYGFPTPKTDRWLATFYTPKAKKGKK